MAGVQVPKIQRMNAPDTASVGRTDANIPNFAVGNGEMTAAVHATYKDIEGYMDRQEKLAADTTATAAANEYQRAFEDGFVGSGDKLGVKYQQGDPTPVYKQFDDSMAGVRAAIIEKHKDASEYTQQLIEKKLAQTEATLANRRSSAYGVQLDNYNNSVADNKNKIETDNMVDASAGVIPGDIKSLDSMRNTLERIKENRLMQGLKNGATLEVYGEDGQIKEYKNTPKMNIQIAKDSSEAIYRAIDNANASNRPDVAKYIADNFKDYMDPVNRAKAEKQTEKTNTEVMGLNEFNKVSELPYDKAQSAIDKIKDPRVRMEAMKNLEIYTVKKEKMISFSQKANYDKAADYVLKNRANFDDPAELNQDKVLRRYLPNMSPKQRLSLESMIQPPKISDSQALINVMDVIQNEGLQGIPAADIHHMVKDLNRPDQNRILGLWTRSNSQTGAQENAMMKQVSTMLRDELQASNYIKKDRYGKFTNADQVKFIEANRKMQDTMEREDWANLSYKERSDRVRSMTAGFLKTGAFEAPPTEKFQSRPVQKPKAPTTMDQTAVPGATVPKVNGRSVIDIARDFNKQFNRWPNTNSQEWKDYLDKNR